MKYIEIENLDWKKMSGLIPAIVQDANTLQVLMMGYMNQEALQQTLQEKAVIFYSRSKQRLWKKGETSGNFLKVIDILQDCDNDCLLILVDPEGDCCHLEKESCFYPSNIKTKSLKKLTDVIQQRYEKPLENSYTSKLFAQGVQRIAQKVGEEAVEVALAAVVSNTQEVIAESADLIYHWLILLRQCNVSLQDVIDELHLRMNKLAV